MGLYLGALAIGAIGFVVMALSGLGRHGHGGGQGHGHGAPGHGSHGHGGHGSHVAHAPISGTARVAGAALMAPRLLLAALIGFGLTGVVLTSLLSGWLLAVSAIIGGILFERILVSPLWNFALRFASDPAVTLESALTAEATAVTGFDRNGQGIIALEIDGQVQQVLATLSSADQAAGARVRAGQRVRVEDVDGSRQRCTVTVL